MHHVVVAFNESDLILLSDQLDQNCILISDVAGPQNIAKHVKPELDLGTESELSSKVKDLFELFEQKFGFDSISGFANNFYECSVAPIYEFIVTLNNLLINLGENQESVVVWFPAKYFFSTKYSSYFMAEHESQGQRLYSREAVFLPYLEEVCRLNGAILKYKRTQLGIRGFSQRILRVSAVLCWRFVSGLREALFRSNSNFKKNGSYDVIAITRSVSQTEFLMPFLIRNGISTAFLAGESTLGRGRNAALVDKFSSNYSQIAGFKIRFSLQTLFANYLRALWLMLTKPHAHLKSHNITLNLDQAMTEVLAMWPDLLEYRNALHKELKKVGVPRKNFLLSTEQKSPHAHADAWVAAQSGLICVHLMQCDQSARPLPNPVYGDYFLADSSLNATIFAKVWDVDILKVRYIGSFKACNIAKVENISTPNTRPRWCFFATVDDVGVNKKVLHLLREICQNTSLDIVVKLHPRDNAAYYDDFPDFSFYSDGDVMKSRLFDSFDFAISFPSGVILDLIFNNKPFLLLLFGKWNTNEYSFLDEKYEGNMLSPADLDKFFSHDFGLREHFKSYRERFYCKNNIIVDPVVIWNELLKINNNELIK